MNKIFKISMSLMMVGTLASCEDVFEPEPENNLPLDYVEQNASYAQGLIGNCYITLPGFQYNEPATDDAVSNDANNDWRRMATGSWTSNFNPVNKWQNYRSAIQYANLLLENLEDVTWSRNDDAANKLFHDRFYGEALAMRGIMNFYLLQAHAGIDNSGELLGIPVIEVAENASSNFNVPRNTYKECVDAIKKDFETARKYIPTEYGEAYYPELRQMYPGISDNNLQRVFGDRFQGRVSGRIIQGFLSRLTLMSASDAFSKSGVTWEEAANAAAALITRNGALMEVPADGLTWYCDPNIKNLGDWECPPEILWRDVYGNSTSLEEEHFPPTLYGSGRMNPTQNLVDAFPMENGYPINDPLSGYDEKNPYADRDPRLAMYILYDGAKAGSNNTEIHTLGHETNDGTDMTDHSTRTGYYMKKHLNMSVNCDPSNKVQQTHYTARMRFTEFLLNYAEAANEAWGPTGTGSNAFSAYDVIKEIRIRAGIGYENGDAYLEKCKASKESMRELIRNERRLELCFEGFRFYDLRRWNVSLDKLNETAKGIRLENGVYTPFDVENRNYKAFMIYCPIPYSETLKFSNLQQNAGW